LKCSSEIIAVSPALKNQIEKIYPQTCIRVIPNRVEVQPKGLLTKQKRVAIIGDVRDEVKGISQALEWCSHVFPKFELCLVGDGPDLTSIKNRFNSVSYHSAMSHDSLMDFIEESSVIVVNSPFETFSILASEVQQLGTYLLCRKNGGPEDFASNQVLWFSSEVEFKLGANTISQWIEQNQHPLPFQNDLLKGERIKEMWKEVLK
jgi:glycosyltransferase involved in cell wall biosynthesis